MLIVAKTKICIDTGWLAKLSFKEHDDLDLAGNVDAVSIKSNDGGIHSFYRNKPIENPSDFMDREWFVNIKKVVCRVSCCANHSFDETASDAQQPH